MQFKIVSDDGWLISAPTYAEAHATAADMLIDTVGDITLEEAEALIEHDVDRGIILIIGKGYNNVH